MSETQDKALAALAVRLEQLFGPAAGAPGDAIDAALARPPRQTAVASLRKSPEFVQLRQDLADGLIRVDVAERILNLIDKLMQLALV